MGWLPLLVGVALIYLIATILVRRLWIASSLNSDSLEQLLRRRDRAVRLIDVRSPAEYEAGHIPTAVNIPHTQIAANPPGPDLDRLIVLYCQTGSRSASARARLRRMGFTDVVNFGSIHRFRGELAEGPEPGALPPTMEDPERG